MQYPQELQWLARGGRQILQVVQNRSQPCPSRAGRIHWPLRSFLYIWCSATSPSWLSSARMIGSADGLPSTLQNSNGGFSEADGTSVADQQTPTAAELLGLSNVLCKAGRGSLTAHKVGPLQPTKAASVSYRATCLCQTPLSNSVSCQEQVEGPAYPSTKPETASSMIKPASTATEKRVRSLMYAYLITQS